MTRYRFPLVVCLASVHAADLGNTSCQIPLARITCAKLRIAVPLGIEAQDGEVLMDWRALLSK